MSSTLISSVSPISSVDAGSLPFTLLLLSPSEFAFASGFVRGFACEPSELLNYEIIIQPQVRFQSLPQFDWLPMRARSAIFFP